MKTKNLLKQLLLLLTFFSLQSFAQESAIRDPNENWESALSRNLKVPTSQVWLEGRSAINSAIRYSVPFDVSVLPQWNGTDAELQAAFQMIRDQRPYKQSSRPDFPRRATWLYPRDGCYARAAHAARTLEQSGRIRPGKIFVFGNLKMKSDYDARGAVYWSYHVAAAFRIGDQAFVLDPAADFQRPLLMQEWLARMSLHPTNLRVAICDTYAYSPGSLCIGGSANQERYSVNHQVALLPSEWNLLVSLRKNPEALLGDQPPWSGIRRAIQPVIPIRTGDRGTLP